MSVRKSDRMEETGCAGVLRYAQSDEEAGTCAGALPIGAAAQRTWFGVIDLRSMCFAQGFFTPFPVL
jgi:hypothetical protein